MSKAKAASPQIAIDSRRNTTEGLFYTQTPHFPITTGGRIGGSQSVKQMRSILLERYSEIK